MSSGAGLRLSERAGVAGAWAAGALPMIAEGVRGVVQALEYSDVSRPKAVFEQTGGTVTGVPEAEVEARVAAACARERSAVEERLRAEWAEREGGIRAEAERAVERRVSEALLRFAEERRAYFARVETEVVGLSLGIARKILGREATMDAMLLAGLVRVALDGMQRGVGVRLKVAVARGEGWRRQIAGMGLKAEVEVVEDAGVLADECVLETESGSTRLSWEGQMKEVERGVLDLLGQRPDVGAAATEGTVQ